MSARTGKSSITSEATAKTIDTFVKDGGTILYVGTAGFFDKSNNRYLSPVIESLGVRRIGKITNDILSAYFEFSSKVGFPRFDETDLVYLHNTYVYADYEDGVKKYMRLTL